MLTPEKIRELLSQVVPKDEETRVLVADLDARIASLGGTCPCGRGCYPMAVGSVIEVGLCDGATYRATVTKTTPPVPSSTPRYKSTTIFGEILPGVRAAHHQRQSSPCQR